MPLYEYENTQTGQLETLIKPVAERDNVPAHLRRRTCPSRVAVLGYVANPNVADTSVPKAFKELEQTMPVAEIERVTGYKRDEIKRIWGM